MPSTLILLGSPFRVITRYAAHIVVFSEVMISPILRQFHVIEVAQHHIGLGHLSHRSVIRCEPCSVVLGMAVATGIRCDISTRQVRREPAPLCFATRFLARTCRFRDPFDRFGGKQDGIGHAWARVPPWFGRHI